MSIGALVYRSITRRFSTLFLAASVGAFVVNYTFDTITDAFWDKVNVGKQWKDIKAKLENPE
ncbi:Ubiquinol--cytochrome-c reductase subunit 9 [Trichostrongylus colubriformis]|uniref:Complex III subunit 9 n=1 Tax=Trichostrongylus colubriformis TaxID=6319 RepID=A0AAN8ISZ4_TRICO